MKMKHLLLAAVAATPLMLAGQAYAVDTITGLDADPTVSNIDDCSLLSANVTVRLSANVHGAVLCNTTNGDLSAGMIFFGTCHATGSVADRTITCTDVKLPDAACTKVGEVITQTGRAAFLGSSNGGVITGLNLNNTTCDTDANIQARVTTLYEDTEASLAP